MEEKDNLNIEETTKVELVKKLKNKLRDGEPLYIQSPLGEHKDGEYIEFDKTSNTISLWILETTPLTSEEQEEKDRLWEQWDEMGEEEDRLMDKAYPDSGTELSEFFAKPYLKKLEKLQEEMEEIMRRHDAIRDKEKRTIVRPISKEEAQVYIEEMVDLKLSQLNKNENIDEWFDE